MNNRAKSVNGEIPNTEVRQAIRCQPTVTRRGRNNAPKSALHPIGMKMYADLTLNEALEARDKKPKR